MRTDLNQKKHLPLLVQALYLLFLFSLVCSFRAISSLSIGLLLFCGILINRKSIHSFLPGNSKKIFLVACASFYFVNIIPFLYANNLKGEWDHIRIQSALLAVPLVVNSTINILPNGSRKLLVYFSLILAATSAWCLFWATKNYLDTEDISFFFYHKLVSPFSQHAIYFSVLTVIGLAFLLESLTDQQFIVNKTLHALLILYLSGFLLLLSSKLLIVIYALYVADFFIRRIRKTKGKKILMIGPAILALVLTASIFIAQNEISDRYYEILKGNLGMVQQNRFDKGDYFNGLQFRLLQWRFVPEILSENHRWWIGMSPGDAQAFLDKKYEEKNMYTGDPSKGTVGYQIYNTHNQFLETLLQTGIIGLTALLFLVFAMMKIAWQSKDRLCRFVGLLLLTWMFTESVLVRQYGITIFCFFPLFLYPNKKQAVAADNQPTLL